MCGRIWLRARTRLVAAFYLFHPVCRSFPLACQNQHCMLAVHLIKRYLSIRATIGVSMRIDAFVTRTGELGVTIHSMDDPGNSQAADLIER